MFVQGSFKANFLKFDLPVKPVVVSLLTKRSALLNYSGILPLQKLVVSIFI